LALIRLACRDQAGAKHEDATFRGLIARFAGRDDLQHSLRYAVNCSMLFIEAPWLEPHGSEVEIDSAARAGLPGRTGKRTVLSGGRM
jgi:hypothetical protein